MTSDFICKVKFRLWEKLVYYMRNKPMYPYIYLCYWHYKFSKKNLSSAQICFFSACPNHGAGIGHQMANWIAGYWFAKQFNLKFAHMSFSSPGWEYFLGFGENETIVEELTKTGGYKKVKLPLFNEFNLKEVERIKNIIHSYHNQKIIFIAEQDQFYRDQFGVMGDIKNKFYLAKARQFDRLLYSKDFFNIAVHLRRGDIVTGKSGTKLQMRWQGNDYFINVLATVLCKIKTNKEVAIYLFSQGERKEFLDFEVFDNVNFCLNNNVQESFMHMVYADLLITSKSSFSYKPALLSNGIKICPRDFWHGYPEDNDWILAEKDGSFNNQSMLRLESKLKALITTKDPDVFGKQYVWKYID